MKVLDLTRKGSLMSHSLLLRLSLISGATAMAIVMNELLQSDAKKGVDKTPHQKAVDSAMEKVADATLNATSEATPSLVASAISDLAEATQRITDSLTQRQEDLIARIQALNTEAAPAQGEASADESDGQGSEGPNEGYFETDANYLTEEEMGEADPLHQQQVIDDPVRVETPVDPVDHNQPETYFSDEEAAEIAAQAEAESQVQMLLQPQVFSMPFATLTVYPLIDDIQRSLLHTPSCIMNLLPDDVRSMMNHVINISQQTINAKAGFGTWTIPDINVIIGAAFIKKGSTATTLAADVFLFKFYPSVIQGMEMSNFQQAVADLCRRAMVSYVHDEQIRSRFIDQVVGNSLSVL